MPIHIDFDGWKFFLAALLLIGVAPRLNYPKLYQKAKTKYQRWYFARFLDNGGRYRTNNEKLLKKRRVSPPTTGSYLFPDDPSDLQSMQIGRN
ncbi:MAG: hypothetical protein WC045_01560 [Patescibacteria group bacterium]